MGGYGVPELVGLLKSLMVASLDAQASGLLRATQDILPTSWPPRALDESTMLNRSYLVYLGTQGTYLGT